MKKAAKILELQKKEILQLWEEENKREVSASRLTNGLALRDHLPHLIDDMNVIIKRYTDSDMDQGKEAYKEILLNSKEHGRHRSTTAGYTIDGILREYIIFHRILVEVLKSQNAYTVEVGTIIKFSVEHAMLYSARAFNQSLEELRQKLIGVLAHDMRNPVTAALFAVDMMKEDLPPERFEKVRGMAYNGLKRTMGLIEELLDTITVRAGQGITLHFAEKDLMEMVKPVHAEASEIYSNEVELTYNKEEVSGVFDVTMVQRVLENFLSNAVKYGGRDTPITIIVEDADEEVSLKVHNYGNPIPEEQQERIFRFMNSTTESRSRELKSWGMGLTLVKSIAKAHGGCLELTSSESDGTTFSLTLNKFENTPGKKQAAIFS